jgi:hypothetical protein
MGTYRGHTRNILREFWQASPFDLLDGLQWYDLAYTHCERVGLYMRSPRHVTNVAAALAHLSPLTKWSTNLAYLEALAAGEPRPAGCMTRSWSNAYQALSTTHDPLLTFGRTAYKTRSFYQAICGDKNAVVIDVWTARVAGYEQRVVKTARGYIAAVESYRRAARRVDLAPRDLQAVVWCAHRGSPA